LAEALEEGVDCVHGQGGQGRVVRVAPFHRKRIPDPNGIFEHPQGCRGCSKNWWASGVLDMMKHAKCPKLTLTTLPGKHINALFSNILKIAYQQYY